MPTTMPTTVPTTLPIDKFDLLIWFIVGLAIVGVLLMFGIFGIWRWHNKRTSNRVDAEKTRDSGAKLDPWEAAGKRLNVKDEDDTHQ